MSRFIFVVGGVMSSVGKGAASASIGKLLQSKGYKVTAIKIDPYINVDAGTMNPVEHGEVFVTEDGDETDQDLGNYERFLDVNILSDNYMTTGRVYQTVIGRERNLEYGGRCVEVVPHVPEEVIRRIKRVEKKGKADFIIIEIGGTVGEYQNVLFLEAVRMMRSQYPDKVLVVMVSYLPIPSKVGEMKTKPTQTAVRSLNAVGIQPDILLGRSERPLDTPRKRKLSIFCNVSQEDVISAPDVDSIYEIPLLFQKEKLGERILQKFGLRDKKKDLAEWKKLVFKFKKLNKSNRAVKIGIVGKYFSTGKFVLSDSYISVIEAVKHASWFHGKKPELFWLNSEEYEKDAQKLKELKELDGIIIPGGFGSRGVEGKIKAVEYARKNRIPYLGLCYGMHMAVIEFARHVCKLRNANTAEINPSTKNPVIHIMPDQAEKIKDKRYGGTMRLGAYPCFLAPGSISREAYDKRQIFERHRHRYEFNNDYRGLFQKKGLVLAGTSPDNKLVEIVELSKKDHPFFVGVQFHPEFKSRPLRPHPLFREFIKAAIKKKK
ncbi:MAG: CTP synthase [Patescibacteria group bacterium]|nr:CTP synthase [Patescibacteria group bacterium]MDD5490708.1 CTP synthase [Patescibacteria group bacterium]